MKRRQHRLDAKTKGLAAALGTWLRRFARVAVNEAIERMGKRVAKADTFDSLQQDLEDLVTRYGLAQASESGKDIVGAKWVVPPALLTDITRSKEVRVASITAESRRAAADAIQRIMTEASKETPIPSTGEIQRRLRERFNDDDPETRLFDFSPERAELIARTELVQTENAAISTSLEELGAKEIEWLAFSDGKSGDRHHERMNGKRIKIGERFKTPLGNELRYPGDWLAPIEDTANCRCTIVPVSF